MTWLRTPQAGGRRGPFRPRVEALEDRRVPTVNFIVSGNALFIIAPASRHQIQNERITINDNGSSSRNNVTVNVGPTFFPNVPINNVIVTTGGGNDVVTYNLAGDLIGQRTVLANLGAGNDTFGAVLRRNLLPGSSLSVLANGGSGDDRLQATLIGNVGAGAQLGIVFNGHGGSNILNVFSATLLRVDPGAVVAINLLGGGHAGDHIFNDFFGTMNGTYTVAESGGSGPDKLFADVEVAPGSTGNINGSVLSGGPGNDNLTFLIHAPVGFASANQLIDGGTGFDISTRTPNVIAVNTEQDFLVS
jgi:hypothetical protein